jgi:hypothetical protein
MRKLKICIRRSRDVSLGKGEEVLTFLIDDKTWACKDTSKFGKYEVTDINKYNLNATIKVEEDKEK